jgi:magnesium-protoporphyrin IX monomethyl ester (oxidative) cyclase
MNSTSFSETPAPQVTSGNPALGAQPDIVNAADAIERARASSLLSPRFYSTDYAAMDKIDVSLVRAEFDQLLSEYEGDNNHDHFQRTEDFKSQIQDLPPDLRQEFLDFLVSSLTSEFSGCVLYNEIKKQVTNPDIKALMGYMARDESRHANFLNMSLKDYGLGVDLGDLKRTKAYKYFKPKYIFYATYLSEKIGYARYISIFRQLEKTPEKRFHPIFRWFERWCNDEFRHGESFALIMRANPSLLKGGNVFLIRFFLVAVYATMFVRDHARPLLHEALGLKTADYDYEVFRITTECTKQVFPISLDTDNPAFRRLLESLLASSLAIDAAKAQGGIMGKLKQVVHGAKALTTFVRLYLMPVHHHALPQQIRMVPAW